MALTLTKVFLLISVLACIRTSFAKIEGTFDYTGGFKCKWMEQSFKKTLCRNFRVNCRKPGTTEHYACVYSGQPHGCNAYNKGQQAFYAEPAFGASSDASYKTVESSKNMTCADNGEWTKWDWAIWE